MHRSPIRFPKPAPLRLATLAALALVPLLAAAPVHAGAFQFATEANGVDNITHPNGYTAAGGTVNVEVCIDSASPLPAGVALTDLEIPTQNVIAVWNALAVTTGNVVSGAANNVPAGEIDFESVLLHEVGHCLGLAHVNAASESGLPEPSINSTKATDGANDALNVAPGADGLYGSSDDPRGDDVNLHWFRIDSNDPGDPTLPSPVDASTFARDVASLPAGHSFATNLDIDVATLLGYADTEAVMQQGVLPDQAQRTLAADGAATILLAASGVDETAGTGDDNILELTYGGISSAASCQISIGFETGVLGVCGTGAILIAANHVVLNTNSIGMGLEVDWFYNQDPVGPPPPPPSPTIPNGSFENPAGPPDFVPPTSWSKRGPATGWGTHPNAAGLVAPDGVQQVYIGNGAGEDAIYSDDLAGALSPNTTYALSGYIGWRSDDIYPLTGQRTGTLQLVQGGSGATDTGTVLVSVTKDFDSTAGDTLGTYYFVSGSFTTGGSVSADPLRAEIISDVDDSFGSQTWFDLIELEVAPPAPPGLSIATGIPGGEGGSVAVPVELTTGDATVAATTFSVDYDETCLSFDESDVDPADGVPDDVAVHVAGDFTVTVFHDLGDTDGEIDVSITDFSVPIATLSDGPLVTITFTVTCPAMGAPVIAPVAFSSDPAATFSDDLGVDVAGITTDGSVEVLPGLRGDCNGSGALSVADLVADGLEMFDDDGSFWLDVPGSTYAGDPVGCDANADADVDAGDLSCTVLLIFGGTCGGTRFAEDAVFDPETSPVLGLGRARRGKDGRLWLPVVFAAGDHEISSVAFSLDLAGRGLAFDPGDGDGDGVPDAVRFPDGRPDLVDVRYDAADRGGELDFTLATFDGALAGGLLFEVAVRPHRDRPLAAWRGVRFARTPAASFGNVFGQAVAGRAVDDGK